MSWASQSRPDFKYEPFSGGRRLHIWTLVCKFQPGCHVSHTHWHDEFTAVHLTSVMAGTLLHMQRECMHPVHKLWHQATRIVHELAYACRSSTVMFVIICMYNIIRTKSCIYLRLHSWTYKANGRQAFKAVKYFPRKKAALDGIQTCHLQLTRLALL